MVNTDKLCLDSGLVVIFEVLVTLHSNFSSPSHQLFVSDA